MASVVYEKVKEMVEANSFTDVQVADMTKDQFTVLTGIDVELIGDAAFEVAKTKLLRVRDREKWQTTLQGLKDQLTGGGRVWLTNNFPDVEFTVDHRRKTVTIFFDGKPQGGEL